MKGCIYTDIYILHIHIVLVLQTEKITLLIAVILSFLKSLNYCTSRKFWNPFGFYQVRSSRHIWGRESLKCSCVHWAVANGVMKSQMLKENLWLLVPREFSGFLRYPRKVRDFFQQFIQHQIVPIKRTLFTRHSFWKETLFSLKNKGVIVVWHCFRRMAFTEGGGRMGQQIIRLCHARPPFLSCFLPTLNSLNHDRYFFWP